MFQSVAHEDIFFFSVPQLVMSRSRWRRRERSDADSHARYDGSVMPCVSVCVSLAQCLNLCECISAESEAHGGGVTASQDPHPLQRLRGGGGRSGLRPTHGQTLDATHRGRQGEFWSYECIGFGGQIMC